MRAVPTIAISFLFLGVISSRVVDAQPRTGPAGPPGVTPPLNSLKNESTAVGLAVGLTVLGIGTTLVGPAVDSPDLTTVGGVIGVIGPSTGHLYAGEIGHAVVTSLLRAGIVYTVTSAIRTEHEQVAGIVVAGVSLYFASAIYDHWDSRRAVRRHNAAVQRAALIPLSVRAVDGRAPGMGLAVSF